MHLLSKAAALLFICLATPVFAHDSRATYLGNEGVMVKSGSVKVMFDPFFQNNFNLYTLVPNDIRQAIFANQPPYDDINYIFVSHAHEDHYDAKDVARYLKQFPKVQLIAPQQAIDLLKKQETYADIQGQLRPLNLANGDAPHSMTFEKLHIESVRIPHTGWPQMSDVENLIYRISGEESASYMHLGDADEQLVHFKAQQAFFQQTQSDITFLPYWFALSAEGRVIMDEHLNARHLVGIHVPTQVPKSLQGLEFDFFSTPGEVRTINQ